MSAPDVTIFGMGYVGTVVATSLARHGVTVAGVEPSDAKRALYAAGKIPFEEPGLSEAYVAHRERIRIGGSLEAVGLAPIALICVGTPRQAKTGACDASAVFACLKEIGTHLRPRREDHLVLIRSTLWPGLWEDCVRALQEPLGRPVGGDVRLGVQPEFMREGSSLKDFDEPTLHVVGVEEERDAQAVAKLHGFVKIPLIHIPPREALLLKYASNAFHALKVAFANEMGSCASAFGVDPGHLMSLFSQDRRLNISPKYLKPGLPFGGSCLPKDVSQLESWARESGRRLPILENLLAANEAQTARIVESIRKLGVRKVAFVGLAFKGEVDDLRGSPVIEIIRLLTSSGMEVVGIDPTLRADRLVDLNRALYDQLRALRGFELRDDFSGGEQAVFFSYDSPAICSLFSRVRPGVPTYTFFPPAPEMMGARRI